MKFRHRDGWVSGSVALELRTRAEVDDHAEFEIPDDLQDDTSLLQRLVDAGHEPVDPAALPSGVDYDPDPDDGDEAEGATEDDVDEAESGPPPDEDTSADDEGDAPSDGLPEDRSDLWELAHSEEFDAEPDFSWNESTVERLQEWIREQREEA